ncbi:C39 family peptidase [Burkholderia sp. AU30198]|uniref:C39 family peptidase n=1 Tax=Burkholderia sp. AU30198 TaxID=2879627 RepID=UPI001CF5CC3D|nr:C39 family peptidase [Burkholderia sp. AU30198]MCA8292780.1 C39 family peptidase [Burkholderia sp. AU30198]
MSNLRAVERSTSASKYTGLVSLTGYHPWAPKYIEAMKHSIAEGFPVLIRLHSAADYTAPGYDNERIDLESHAVLLTGYDDRKEAFVASDPWDRKWGGGFAGKRWISYETITCCGVDSSLGVCFFAVPPKLDISESIDESGNFMLRTTLSTYKPRIPLMDKENMRITHVIVSCVLAEENRQRKIVRDVKGNWALDGANVSLQLAIGVDIKPNLDINLEAELLIRGERPYVFEDRLFVRQPYIANKGAASQSLSRNFANISAI